MEYCSRYSRHHLCHVLLGICTFDGRPSRKFATFIGFAQIFIGKAKQKFNRNGIKTSEILWNIFLDILDTICAMCYLAMKWDGRPERKIHTFQENEASKAPYSGKKDKSLNETTQNRWIYYRVTL